jgi:hypothetical protein
MVIRIDNNDIRRNNLEKTDWNKYAIVINGGIFICGTKKRAKEVLKDALRNEVVIQESEV